MPTVLETIIFIVTYSASLLASALPIVAFEYTGEWTKVFDCFGPEALIMEVFYCGFKLAFFLFALGKDSLNKVLDTITSLYVEIVFAGLALFLYHTVKKHKGEKDRISVQGAIVIGLCLCVLAIFGTLSYMEYEMSWPVIQSCYSGQVIMLVILNLWPVGIRFVKDEFEDDEPLVFKFKMVAIVIGLVTGVVDSVNFHKEDFPNKWMLLSLSIGTALASAIQLVIRVVGPRKVKIFIDPAVSKICNLFWTVQHFSVCLMEWVCTPFTQPPG